METFQRDVSTWRICTMSRPMEHRHSTEIYQMDVSSVTDMGYMFDEASEFNGDLSKWNTSSVEDFGFMFKTLRLQRKHLNLGYVECDHYGWDV